MQGLKRTVLVEGRGRNKSTGKPIQFKLYSPRQRGNWDFGLGDHQANQRIIRALRDKVELEEVRHHDVLTRIPGDLESYADLPSYKYFALWRLDTTGCSVRVRHPYFPLDPVEVGKRIAQGNWQVLEFTRDQRDPHYEYEPRHTALVKIGNEIVLLRNGDDFLVTQRIRSPFGNIVQSSRELFMGNGLYRILAIVPNKNGYGIMDVCYTVHISISDVSAFSLGSRELTFHAHEPIFISTIRA